MNNDTLRSIYAAFDPAPLLGDSTDLYVDLDEVRGDADVVKRISSRISFALGKATCQVLAGHYGSGKSTELARLKRSLEHNDPATGNQKMFVVFCKADDDIDRNDVDFPDLLVAILRQTAKQLRERAQINLQPGYFRSRFQELKKFLSTDVAVEKLDLETGLGKLGISIKGSPDARKEIRALMEPDAGNLLSAANAVIAEAVHELFQIGYCGLVILVDDLDKMVVRSTSHGCPSDEHLFVNRAAQLTGFNCHVVYSMPISLAYSHHEAAIKASYGGHVPVVPMTKITTRPPNPKPHKIGVDKFRQIVRQRLNRLGATVSDVFENDGVQAELIALSGGQPRELMLLVRDGIISTGLPITSKAIDRAKREGQRDYDRLLRSEHWPLIEAVRQTGRCERTTQNEPLFRELLASRSILCYENGEEWYGLNPMVAAIKRPAETLQ